MGTKELSLTAFLIAWGRSTDPALSLDPYAHVWLTDDGIEFAKKFTKVASPFAPYFFCLRSRYLVTLLRSFEEEHPGFTLINVGAGLTSYPFILSEKTDVINIDQPHVIEYYKQKASEGKLPKRNITYLSIDLNGKDGLKKFGRLLSEQKKPTFVLFEGILTYLDKKLALELVSACSRRLSADSRVVVHVALDDLSTSKVWNNIERFFKEELGLPAPHLTIFSEKELASAGSLKLLEHVGFREIAERSGTDPSFTDDQLIDERFFLFEKE